VDASLKDCDGVYNLAAQVHVDVSRNYPRLFYETNVGGTFNVLEAARRNNVRLIHMSSCEVLGHIEEGRADESYPYRYPRSPYAASKLAAEEYVYSYSQTYGLDCNTARGFNLLGPRQRPGEKGAVIPKFAEMMLHGVAPTIYGDGEQTRDYLDVRDLCRGLYMLMKCRDYVGEVFHFCSGVGYTLNQIVALLRDSVGEDAPVPVYGEPRPGELRRSVGCYGKAERLLGWRPRIPLPVSVRDIVEAQRLRV